MELKNSELEFLSRLLNHHVAVDSLPKELSGLCDKLHNAAHNRGLLRLDMPLPLYDGFGADQTRVFFGVHSGKWEEEMPT